MDGDTTDVGAAGGTDGAPESGGAVAAETAADAGGGAAGAQEPQGQEGATQQPGPGPWATDLERFPEEVRGDIDSYLRETWQPRVTQLEQGQMPEGISQFLDDISKPETADQAFLQMAYELYGDDALPFFETALQYAYGDQGQQPQGDQGQQPVQQEDGFEIDLDPEDREILDEVKAEREDARYKAALSEFQAEHKDLPEDVDRLMAVLSPFVLAAEGDIDEGYQLYTEWRQAVDSGQVTEEQAADAAEAGIKPEELTPQTLGLQGQSPGTPVVKQGQSIGEAVEELMADMRASGGPPALG